MRTAGNAGGSAPDAITCFALSCVSRLSKWRISPGPHVRNPNSQAGGMAFDPREIHQFVQCPLERFRGVERSRTGAQRYVGTSEGKWIGLEKPWNAPDHREPVLRPARQTRAMARLPDGTVLAGHGSRIPSGATRDPLRRCRQSGSRLLL